MEVVVPSDDELLSYTQQVRLRVARNMTADGQVPVDPKEIKALAGILKDIDSQVQTKQRLQQDNANAQSDREFALNMARISESIQRSASNPFKINGQANNGKDDSALPAITIVPGQTDVGASQDTYRDFMATHGVQD